MCVHSYVARECVCCNSDRECGREEALRQEDMAACGPEDLCAGGGVRDHREGAVWRLGYEKPVNVTSSLKIFLLFSI